MTVATSQPGRMRCSHPPACRGMRSSRRHATAGPLSSRRRRRHLDCVGSSSKTSSSTTTSRHTSRHSSMTRSGGMASSTSRQWPHSMQQAWVPLRQLRMRRQAWRHQQRQRQEQHQQRARCHGITCMPLLHT